jgi:hypothetical protein
MTRTHIINCHGWLDALCDWGLSFLRALTPTRFTRIRKRISKVSKWR